MWWSSDSSTATVPSLPMDGQSPRTAAPNCYPGVATRCLRTSSRPRTAPTEMNARSAAATSTTNRCSAAVLVTSSTKAAAVATPASTRTVTGPKLLVGPSTPDQFPAPNAAATSPVTMSASTTASAAIATPTSSQTSRKPTLDKTRPRSNHVGLFFCWAVTAGVDTAPVSSRIHRGRM